MGQRYRSRATRPGLSCRGQDVVALGAAGIDGDLTRDRRYSGGVRRDTFMDGARPEVWVADRHGGQQGHGATRQMCLAHLLHDAAYASKDSDGGFAPGFRRLLLRGMAIGKRRAALKDSTLAQYHAGLERHLDRLLPGPMPEPPAARRLFRAMRRGRERHRHRTLAWADRVRGATDRAGRRSCYANRLSRRKASE